MKKLLLAICCLGLLVSTKAQTIPSTNITVMSWYRDVLIGPVNNKTNFSIDFNLTNAIGYYIYQTIKATNDVYFQYTTNASRSRMVTFSVLAFGGDRKIGILTNLPHFRTNGLTIVGNYYTFTLTNGNEFRFTLETNSATMSTLWTVNGQ